MSTFPAVVADAPKDGQPQWRYEQIKSLRGLQQGELLIRVAAVGICHTDIFVSTLPAGTFGVTYPKILGHEGAGEVEAIGPGVTVAKPGDKVLLSYNFCGKCDLCTHDKQSYCEQFVPCNTIGEAGIFEESTGKDATGRFFGQSSLASLTVVSEKTVVNVESLIQTPEELKRCAPMGCGLMTGTGAVLKEIKPHDILIVVGIGAVGAGAIMAAKIVGCKAVIAVDRVQSRLDVAKEIGATHVYDTSKGGDFITDVQALVDNQRIAYAIDTTGVPELMQQSLQSLGKRGKLIQIGVPPVQSSVTLPLGDFFFQTKVFEVNFLGDAKAPELLPQMVQWYKEGKYPIDKIVKFYRASDVNVALEEMKTGVIKPILKF